MTAKTCKRLGCGKSYTDESNHDNACQHHPGWPLFSNLSKQWTCCKVEKYDWEDFMKVPGCAHGLHSDVKPVQVKAADTHNDYAPKPIVPAPLPIVTEAAKPSLVPTSSEPKPASKPFLTESGKYKCSNAGCNKEFEPEENDGDCCSYHPGKPIFRDTKKYWTCCEKYSYEWDDFLKLEQCQRGKHSPKMVPA